MIPILSICCITYNHENYIRSCIEGFLLQKTDFPIEILIFDDASTDETPNIIKEYAVQYSNMLTFLQTENQWKYRKYGLIDWLLPNAKGKYIAFCEGDDYWTDPLKLQKQVDVLSANDNLSGVCTAIEVNNIIENKVHFMRNLSSKGKYFTFSDVCNGIFFPTCTIVFKNMKNISLEWARKSPLGDIPLLLELTKDGGYLEFLDFTSAVYRIHSGGVFGSKSKIMQLEKIEKCFLEAYKNKFGIIKAFYILRKILKIRYALYLRYSITGDRLAKVYFWKVLLLAVCINPIYIIKLLFFRIPLYKKIKLVKIDGK